MVLIVKGNKHQAALAAADHGIPAAFLQEFQELTSTTVRVPDSYADKAAAWFLEDKDPPPYPVGSCLWYG